MKVENMMKWIIRAALACSLIVVGACSKSDKDGEGQKNQAANAQQTQTVPTTQQAAAEIPDEDVPVETDFEEAADREISAENYSQELEKLEKEIGGGS